jgi:hypothetical protein
MVSLEKAMSGIERAKDFAFFLTNKQGIWGSFVLAGNNGTLAGFIHTVCHPGSTMIGPGVMRDEESATALLWYALHHLRGHKPVWLLPCHCGSVVKAAYAWGARNCEIHVAQIRGPALPSTGVTMPTFMPETG